MKNIILKDLLHKWKEFFCSIFKDKDEDRLENLWQKALKEQEKEIKEYNKETETVLKQVDNMNSDELLKFIAKTIYKVSRRL